jgi:hypothetical protein
MNLRPFSAKMPGMESDPPLAAETPGRSVRFDAGSP